MNPIVSRSAGWLVGLLFLGACGALRAAQPLQPPAAAPLVAVATAFAPEFAALVARIEEPRRERVNGVEFVRGNLAGVDVVLFATGISIVNATMTMQLAIDRFAVTEVVVSGIAGAVDEGLAIGDVAVPSQWAKYDEMVFLRDDAPADDPAASLPEGIFVDFPRFDFMAPRGMDVRRAGAAPQRRFWYAADARLLDIARGAAGKVVFARCLQPAMPSTEEQTPDCLPAAPRARFDVHGVSGSIFMDNARFRRYLSDTFNAGVVEMETAAIAQVAYANSLPFIAFRSVSDRAGGEAEGNVMGVFFRLAAENAARLVEAYLAERGAVAASAPAAAYR